MQTKLCSKCRQEKSISDFYRSTKSPDGLQYICKDCIKEYNKASRATQRHQSAATPIAGNPQYKGVADRTLQEQAKAILNELRARGWQIDCSISYLHTKKL